MKEIAALGVQEKRKHLISFDVPWISTNILMRIISFKQEFSKLIVRRQDKCKQAIFFVCLGLCAVQRVFKNLELKDPECEPA